MRQEVPVPEPFTLAEYQVISQALSHLAIDLHSPSWLSTAEGMSDPAVRQKFNEDVEDALTKAEQAITRLSIREFRVV